MGMLRTFFEEFGHFAFDDTWIGAETTCWQTAIGDIVE